MIEEACQKAVKQLIRIRDYVLRNPLMKRVMRNSGYILSANGIATALSMIQGIIAARLLGIVAFGMLSPITQLVTNLNRLTSFRMAELVVSYVGKYSAEKQDQHAAALVKLAGLVEFCSSVVAFLLVVVLAPLGASVILKNPAVVDIIRMYAVVLLANMFMETSRGVLQYNNKFDAVAIVTVVQSSLTLALIGAVFLMKTGLAGVVLSYTIGKTFGGLANTFLALRTAREQWGPGWWRANIRLLSAEYREIARFGISTNLNGTIALVTRDSDTLWLSALSSPLHVGYYKVAKAFMNVLVIPVEPMISTTYREIAREAANKAWVNVRYLLRTGTLIAGAYTLLAGAALVILGPWLVRLYGAEFAPAYGIMLVLMLGFMVSNVFYWNRRVFLVLGMPDYPTRVAAVLACFELLLMFWLVPLLGAYGISIAMSFYFLVLVFILVTRAQVEINRRSKADAENQGVES